MRADFEQLTGIREIGPKIAASIISFFEDEDNLTIINRLKKSGLRFRGEEIITPLSGKLEGKTIVISGIFKHHTREEYKEIIEKQGGRNSTSISGNTSFILAGENMGPSKKEKADGLGIPFMDEKEFLRLIDED
jgi:DNA ligase (NAD+)